jgi:hypothetical protein
MVRKLPDNIPVIPLIKLSDMKGKMEISDEAKKIMHEKFLARNRVEKF